MVEMKATHNTYTPTHAVYIKDGTETLSGAFGAPPRSIYPEEPLTEEYMLELVRRHFGDRWSTDEGQSINDRIDSVSGIYATIDRRTDESVKGRAHSGSGEFDSQFEICLLPFRDIGLPHVCDKQSALDYLKNLAVGQYCYDLDDDEFDLDGRYGLADMAFLYRNTTECFCILGYELAWKTYNNAKA